MLFCALGIGAGRGGWTLIRAQPRRTKAVWKSNRLLPGVGSTVLAERMFFGETAWSTSCTPLLPLTRSREASEASSVPRHTREGRPSDHRGAMQVFAIA